MQAFVDLSLSAITQRILYGTISQGSKGTWIYFSNLKSNGVFENFCLLSNYIKLAKEEARTPFLHHDKAQILLENKKKKKKCGFFCFVAENEVHF